jgi:hypothetical protein
MEYEPVLTIRSKYAEQKSRSVKKKKSLFIIQKEIQLRKFCQSPSAD